MSALSEQLQESARRFADRFGHGDIYKNLVAAAETLDSIEAWAKDQALPPHSEFVQGVRSAQQRVLLLLRKGTT